MYQTAIKNDLLANAKLPFFSLIHFIYEKRLSLQDFWPSEKVLSFDEYQCSISNWYMVWNWA